MHPGLTEDFIGGVLEAELLRDKLSLPEALLRLALNDCEEYTLTSQEDVFIQLNFRAKGTCLVSFSDPPHSAPRKLKIILNNRDNLISWGRNEGGSGNETKVCYHHEVVEQCSSTLALCARPTFIMIML